MNENKPPETTATRKAERIFHHHGGMLRTKDALARGIHPSVLYQLRDQGKILQVSRGVYRLASLTPLQHPDFIPIAIKAQKAVICLISALAFHELTLEIPHQVWIALTKGDWSPRIEYPPIRIFWFSPKTHSAGIEIHHTDGISIQIYSPEKTIVDCFKFRNKIGTNVAVEALKIYMQNGKWKIPQLMHFAHLARVQKVMKPYLEALL